MSETRNTSIILGLFVILSLGFIAIPAALAADPVNTTFFGNLALDGYDPVAYFSDGRAVKGSKKFTTKWNGANWRFSNQEHLDAFVAEPERFAPQYGGYCAWAVSQGDTADVDPEIFKIVDDKLYLNYNEEIQTRWEQDIPGFIAKADEQWPKILAE